MGTSSVFSMVLFQGGDIGTSDHSGLLVIFVGIIAFCSFVQFLVLVGAAIAGLKAYKSVSAEIGVLKQKAMPIIGSVQKVVEDIRPKVSAISAKVQEVVEDSTPKVKVITTKVQEIVEDATPKVKMVTTNVADMSTVVRNKVHEFEATLDKANETVRAANDKTRAQVDRVDGMVSSTLQATSNLGDTIHRGIKTPVLEVAGVVKGVKAAIDVLLGKNDFAGGSARNSGQKKPGSGKPGPVPVPSSGFTGASTEFDPSSGVAPSPGAAEVAERFRREQMGKL